VGTDHTMWLGVGIVGHFYYAVYVFKSNLKL